VPTDLTPHLDGLAAGELRVSRCRRCRAAAFPPRSVCGACSAEGATEWIVATGRGTVWSFAVFRKAYLPGHPPPYVVAVVELEEGVRLISNVVGTEPAEARVGARVEAVVERGTDGSPPRVLFRLDATTPGEDR
jgi:uncharacterized OB-fold protein